MTDPKDTAPDTTAKKPNAFKRAELKLEGFFHTLELRFHSGKLQQKWMSGHDPAQVQWVEVETSEEQDERAKKHAEASKADIDRRDAEAAKAQAEKDKADQLPPGGVRASTASYPGSPPRPGFVAGNQNPYMHQEARDQAHIDDRGPFTGGTRSDMAKSPAVPPGGKRIQGQENTPNLDQPPAAVPSNVTPTQTPPAAVPPTSPLAAGGVVQPEPLIPRTAGGPAAVGYPAETVVPNTSTEYLGQ